MCGILCLFQNNSDSKCLNILDTVSDFLKNRGPDSFTHTTTSQNGYNFEFLASVLWLQGENLIKQPTETTKSVFLYNGDVFGGTEIPTDLRSLNGDTGLFQKCLDNTTNLIKTLSNVNGPYALVYLNKDSSEIYFGRDIFGRRSLLIAKEINSYVITSVAAKQSQFKFIELPAIGIFKYNLISETLHLLPWNTQNKNFNTKLQQLESHLQIAINVIQTNQIIHRTFTPPTTHDLGILQQLKTLIANESFMFLLKNNEWNARILELEMLLKDAIKLRITNQPKYCQQCIKTKLHCNHSKIGVLFSGGLDCTILALLADEFVDSNSPIDLLNVAFDRVKDYTTPDRLTGLESYEELKQLRPSRKWNFLEINVTENELDSARSDHICHLIYPLNTILDESLGCALWFASRGQTEKYKSPCRVLLVGMGADELFGGYTRHRAALKYKDWEGLYHSLNEDWENIAHRNLGRDDRVVSDNGRQLRTPYLDEKVVNFVRNLNVWEKTFPTNELPEGVGEKLLLRCLGYHLGLRKACCFKKRALQFGSRIANKKENANEISPRL